MYTTDIVRIQFIESCYLEGNEDGKDVGNRE